MALWSRSEAAGVRDKPGFTIVQRFFNPIMQSSEHTGTGSQIETDAGGGTLAAVSDQDWLHAGSGVGDGKSVVATHSESLKPERLCGLVTRLNKGVVRCLRLSLLCRGRTIRPHCGGRTTDQCPVVTVRVSTLLYSESLRLTGNQLAILRTVLCAIALAIVSPFY